MQNHNHTYTVSNSAGTATTYARADHVHNIGSLYVGDDHPQYYIKTTALSLPLSRQIMSRLKFIVRNLVNV